ncbi:acyltransferase [Enterococcus durans]|uniref:acyltransferase n=1 Tax=Enterococcus durans TaxID=53345 RepID=UPI001E2E00A8|nr:DapH/DapD/GlmU-related protein [Enterococcus durans]
MVTLFYRRDFLFSIYTKYFTLSKIVIGKHCWIGAQSVILKGVHLSDNIVVACNSTVVKSHEADNEIIGGTPVRTLKRNISWCLKEPK